MDIEDIKDICKARGQPTNGSHFELINYLVSDKFYAQAYAQAYVEAEEEAAAPGRVKK